MGLINYQQELFISSYFETMKSQVLPIVINPFESDLINFEFLNFVISYNFYSTPLGEIILASTEIGICYCGFVNSESLGMEEMRMMYKNLSFLEKEEKIHLDALKYFFPNEKKYPQLTLHLKGTEFQIKVWKQLLKIPFSKTFSYLQISKLINCKNGSRAVGSAIGKNPIAFIIPCHRVLNSNGKLAGYRWGLKQKELILKWENNLGL